MTNIITVLKTEKKGKHPDTLEKCHIYKTSKDGLQMNDTYIDTHNPMFEATQEVNNRQQQKHNIKEEPVQLSKTFRNKTRRKTQRGRTQLTNSSKYTNK
jgi:hypothetical protein